MSQDNIATPHPTDDEIVALYFARDERAIAQSHQKYGKYCHSIARAILNNEQDAEECVNDTYLRAWNSIPPQRPARLATYLGKLTRNLSISRYRYEHADKRDANHYTIALDELAECIPDENGEETMSEEIVLREAINAFLRALPKRTRIVFMRRYWYFLSIAAIAESMGMSESHVKVLLMRTRKQFREHLEREEISL